MAFIIATLTHTDQRIAHREDQYRQHFGMTETEYAAALAEANRVAMLDMLAERFAATL